MREADYRVRVAKNEPQGGGKEGTGHGPAGAHRDPRAQPPRPPPQGKAMPFPQVAGPLSTGQPYQPQSQAALRGLLAAPQAGPDFGSNFTPSMESPEIAQAAAMEALKMQLWQMMLGARMQPQPKPWVRSDQAADAAPQGGFTSPSGMYR
jgi:hypothetical protein